MKQTAISDLAGAITACADVLEMDLEKTNRYPYKIIGESKRVIQLPFGKGPLISPKIIDSLVDDNRGIVVLLVKLVGNLYGCVLSDAEQGYVKFMLLDGPRIVDPQNKTTVLPKFWVREQLYKKIFPGLKATYGKGFYEKKWALIEVGRTWMENYLNKKQEGRAAVQKSLDTNPKWIDKVNDNYNQAK